MPLCTHPQLQKNALHYQSIAAGHHEQMGCLGGQKFTLKTLFFNDTIQPLPAHAKKDLTRLQQLQLNRLILMQDTGSKFKSTMVCI